MEANRKRCKVHILPAEKAQGAIIKQFGNLHYHGTQHFTQEYLRSIDSTSHHLYITSDDEIKDGDWAIELDDGRWLQPYRIDNSKWDMESKANYCRKRGTVRKIIATTDQLFVDTNPDSLHEGELYRLPQPSKAFIEKYCELGGIDKVDVEYIKIKTPIQDHPLAWEWAIKVDSHNTITTRPIKNTWSRDEMEELCSLYDMLLHEDFHVMNEEEIWKRIKELKA